MQAGAKRHSGTSAGNGAPACDEAVVCKLGHWLLPGRSRADADRWGGASQAAQAGRTLLSAVP